METGWPPPELLVTVIMHSGMRARPVSAICRRSLAGSMFPLKGWTREGTFPSAMTRSTALAPVYSMLARVVSKWLLLGISDSRFAQTENRMRSAARPWWVGMMCRKPVRSRTTFSNR